MSVYPRKDGIYVFDFWVEGVRFFGSTRRRNQRDAAAVERARREDAKRTTALSRQQRTAPMTVNVALDRFWAEVGSGYKGTYGKTVWAALGWLLDELGSNTLIRDIGPNTITEAIARRRGGKVKNATVNRTVTELLRLILRRAARKWEQTVQIIDWKDFLLPEPKERVRELLSHEETTLTAAMREDYLPAIKFLLLTGLRRKEAVRLTWVDIDWEAETIAVRRKGGKLTQIPLTSEGKAILSPLRGHHDTAVFTYVACATRKGRNLVRGKRYPITESGLATAWRRYGGAKAGLVDFRLHDLRHTTGTRLLRSSGNLRLVQKLLGHEEIATTTKYAHADQDDLREAMEGVTESRKKSRSKTQGAA